MKIETGYTAGLIGAVTEMHARYYADASGFGAFFEAKVASDLAEFAMRLEKPVNQIWHVTHESRISASIAIDGEDLGENIAHLRWFIVDDNLRGTGIGTQLINAAVDFCEVLDFKKCVLWTFKGLDAARRLYEKNGFSLTEEIPGDQWGYRVMEQRFEKIF